MLYHIHSYDSSKNLLKNYLQALSLEMWSLFVAYRQYQLISFIILLIETSQLKVKPLKFMEILLKIALFLYYAHYYLVVLIKFLQNLVNKIRGSFTRHQETKVNILPCNNTHSDVFITTQQMIQLEGFTVERFLCTTRDKATIHFWRIRNQRQAPVRQYPVIIMHGLLQSSASWFLQQQKSNCLPYILAKEGYDVWIGDNRGNRISTQTTSSQQFHNFTLDHLIEEDQPTLINYVLQKTNKQKIIYIGHSQGSTAFVLGLGLNEEIRTRIACFIGLGTIISFKGLNNNNVLKFLSTFYIVQLLNFIGFKRLIHCSKRFSNSIGVLFENSFFHKNIVISSIKQLIGHNEKDKIPEEMLGRIFSHQPGGGSSNNAIHWMQCFRSKGTIKRFDYGKATNKMMYGKDTPSEYCLNHLKDLPFDSYIFRGKRDHLISNESIQDLLSQFNTTKTFLLQLQDYNHLDYLWSQSAPTDIYHKILHFANSQ